MCIADPMPEPPGSVFRCEIGEFSSQVSAEWIGPSIESTAGVAWSIPDRAVCSPAGRTGLSASRASVPWFTQLCRSHICISSSSSAMRLTVGFFQVIACMIVLWITYMVFAVLDTEWGFDGIIGLLYQAIWGVLLSGLSILVVSIVGLPIRLYTPLRKWWSQSIWLPTLILFCGGLLLVLSILFSADQVVEPEGGSAVLKRIPQLRLAVSGWFMLAFGVLHLFPSPDLDKWWSFAPRG